MTPAKKRLLIVEDQRLIAADLENTLMKIGYEVAGNVASGDEAIAAAADLRPDLVLMDIRLRGAMDGIQAAEAIRRQSEIPIVYLTAYADEPTIARAKGTSPFGYVVKPFNERELRAAVEVAIYKHETDRLLAEERARRRSAEEFKLLVECVRDYAIVMLDPGGHVATWNEGARRIKGYEAGEILGKHFSAFYPPEDVASGEPERALEEALRTGRAEREGWRLRKDGSRFWGNVSLTPIRDQSGKLHGFGKVTRDLTERRRGERELEVERLKLRRLVETAPFAVVVYEGPEHVARYSNPRHEQMTGARIEIGRPLLESLPELAGQPVMQILDEVYRTGTTRTNHELHASLLRGDVLEDRWFDVTWQPVLDVAGGVQGVFVSAVEVTDHVIARRNVESAQKLRDTITSNASLGLIMVDARQHCTFMNPAAEEITGYRLAEVQGQPLHAFIHHSRPDGTPYPIEECPIDRALPTKSQETGEEVFVHSDGHFYPVAFTASPILETGRPMGTVIEVRDTTREKAAERERQRILAELRAAMAARDEFLSIASHELRTPLTALDLQLDGLQRSLGRADRNGDSHKALRKVEMAVRQADRLAALVDGLLNVSRITTGRLPLEVQEFDVASLVREVAERFDEEAKHSGSRLEVRVPETMVGRWDRMRVDQALTNLLSNAIKYGRGKPVEIVLSSEGERVRLSVRDQGIGIAPEDMKRIFGRFERAVSSAHYGGLGLGLYIALQIVRAHGGTIDVDSQPGRGATFALVLPRQTAAIADADGAAPPGEATA